MSNVSTVVHHASTWGSSSPGVYLAQINERTVPGTAEGERRNVQLMGPGIFVRLSAILVFQVLAVSRICLDQRRIDARGSCFIYSNSSGTVFPLSTRSRRPLICLEAWRGGRVDLLIRGKETDYPRESTRFRSGFVELLMDSRERCKSKFHISSMIRRMINLECFLILRIIVQSLKNVRSIHFSMKKVAINLLKEKFNKIVRYNFKKLIYE